MPELKRYWALLCLSFFVCIRLLAICINVASAADGGRPLEGKVALQRCARCHSIEAAGQSPLASAPPLRSVYLAYPLAQLEQGFAEGMGSRHPDMPQIQFSSEETEAILEYLGAITSKPPVQTTLPFPSETEPP
jgi:mono/diheme cytochrome c family protein